MVCSRSVLGSGAERFTSGRPIDWLSGLAQNAIRDMIGLSPGDLGRRRAVWQAPGGYPEMRRFPVRQRPGWFRGHARTTIERDVVELSGIWKIAEIGQLLRLLAARTACELVMQGVIDDSPLERQAQFATITRGLRRSSWSPPCPPGHATPHPPGAKKAGNVPHRTRARRLAARLGGLEAGLGLGDDLPGPRDDRQQPPIIGPQVASQKCPSSFVVSSRRLRPGR